MILRWPLIFYCTVKFVSWLLWQYWKNVAWYLQICNGCFIQMSESWPWASCLTETSYTLLEPAHDKTYKMACAPSEDSDHPGHPPSLIRISAVAMKKAWVLSYPLSAQQRLWSDWADAQADLSLRWATMSFCWFCRAVAHLCITLPDQALHF